MPPGCVRQALPTAASLLFSRVDARCFGLAMLCPQSPICFPRSPTHNCALTHSRSRFIGIGLCAGNVSLDRLPGNATAACFSPFPASTCVVSSSAISGALVSRDGPRRDLNFLSAHTCSCCFLGTPRVEKVPLSTFTVSAYASCGAVGSLNHLHLTCNFSNALISDSCTRPALVSFCTCTQGGRRTLTATTGTTGTRSAATAPGHRTGPSIRPMTSLAAASTLSTTHASTQRTASA